MKFLLQNVLFGMSLALACGAATLRTDIEYGRTPAGVPLRLDACIPESAGPHPIAILVHGGGWSGGDKQADITLWFDPLTKAGYTWFSINYRLAPENRWPACFDDVQTAIRWVHAHAAEYDGDSSRIAIFGHSAGGHLAMLAAVRGKGDTAVNVAVGYAPVTDLLQELPTRGGLSKSLQALFGRPKTPDKESLSELYFNSPFNELHGGPYAPRVLLLHGDADKTVPLVQTINFQNKCRELLVPCEVILIPGAPHRLSEWEKHDPKHLDKMIEWLNAAMKQK